jgi:hypothetical protein
MSEFKKYPTEYKDKECLKAALAAQGYTEIEDHEQGQQLFDYHGRATTYLDKTGDKANIIVRRKHVGGAANDLGFKREADGTYTAIVSQFDTHKHNVKWMTDLKRHYNEKVTGKEAKRLNLKPYTVAKEIVVNGRKVTRVQYLQN